MSHPAAWPPSASLNNLRLRADIIDQIRAFFRERHIWEVETPAMSQATVTDIHLHPFQTELVAPQQKSGISLYLMTSPEYHMKRLLAMGSGSIYQLGRCFRNEELGRYHNPEFTLLEWYRVGFTMMDLIQEMDDLLQMVLGCAAAERFSYQDAFMRCLQIDPLTATKADLMPAAEKLGVADFIEQETDFDTMLQLLFALGVEPKIGQDRPAIVYHFPASQASLAKLDDKDPRVAKRFEVYHQGIELANGFEELTDAKEQRHRFMQDNEKRALAGLPIQPIDEHLLAALEHGLPDCSGVALGIDRLVMLALKATQIQDVIAFTTERA